MADELRNKRTGETYDEFIKKFEHKPEHKKTTDDCYTPPAIYEAVKEWAVKEYGIDVDKIVRPFYPGGDYENYDYSGGAVVVDNPPFSILCKIIDFYRERNIPFFLFCPGLTAFNGMVSRPDVTSIVIDGRIIYENGADVLTCFLTNLDDVNMVRTAPDLHRRIQEIQTTKKDSAPKYTYPKEVVTVSRLRTLVRGGVAVEIPKNGGQLVQILDAQRPIKKKMFGAGMLVSPECAQKLEEAKRAAEREAAKRAHVFELSERERAIVNALQ